MENNEVYQINPSKIETPQPNNSIENDLPFKNERHKQAFERLKTYFKKDQLKCQEYLSTLFVLSAIEQAFIETYFTDGGIDIKRLLEESRIVWSNEDFTLITLAAVLFNNIRYKANIDEIFSKLDSSNINVVLEAVKIRYS